MTNLFRWIMRKWWALNRYTDLSTLWPVCLQHAETIEQARGAFYLHMCLDDAYSEFSDDEKIAYVESLS